MTIFRFISETVQDRAIVSMEHQRESVCSLSNSTTFNDLDWPL